ncbi:hypothetical protein, partial [Nereida ignava]|uniref:hypothetical protein n=1 Tax=Nereida ignava TaxID=282199 RepID=UPI0030F812B0
SWAALADWCISQPETYLVNAFTHGFLTMFPNPPDHHVLKNLPLILCWADVGQPDLIRPWRNFRPSYLHKDPTFPLFRLAFECEKLQCFQLLSVFLTFFLPFCAFFCDITIDT